MASRSFIGMENPDGRIVSIYCHWEGTPDTQGPILLAAYTDAFKINALLTLGDLSYLGSEIGEKHDFNAPYNPLWCSAYARDRGDTWRTPLHSYNRSAFLAQASHSNAAYAYLFSDDVWHVCKVSTSHMGEPNWQVLSLAAEVPNHA